MQLRLWPVPRLVTALCLAASNAAATTWTVKPDRSGDAPTIRAAMDSARAGDEIVVCPGTYTWTSESAGSDHTMIHMKPDVVLRSESGPESTILDAEDTGRGVVFLEGAARIEGFTIQNGIGLPLPGENHSRGGGIYSLSETQPQIRNCIVRDNFAGGGGGIYSDAGGAEITDCLIVDNVANDGGEASGAGGLSCIDAVITGCVVRSNSAVIAGGLYAASCTVTDCVFDDNTARFGTGGGGGGAQAAFGTTFTRCTFRNNTGGSTGGGLSVFGPCVVSYCVFIGNCAGWSGAAIFADDRSELILDNCTILGNTAGSPVPATGGIYARESGSVKISSSIIAGNTGAACRGGTIEFSCTNVFGNTDDALCGTDAGGNFSADPRFCAGDPLANGNFTLQENSPCAPGNHPSGEDCGLIGAERVGCEAVSIQDQTWANVKALYRQ